MKLRALAAGAAFIALFGAEAATAQEAQVIRMGDTAMTCQQVATEANEISQMLGGAPEGGVFTSEQAISAATGIAMQGALMSGAGRMLPGMGLVGNALGAAARRQREQEEARRETARTRWYYLNGLYAGRDCDSRLAQEAQAAPATPAAN